MPDKHLREFTLSGLREGRSNVTVITGSGIDVESGLPSFRGEKGYYEDKDSDGFAEYHSPSQVKRTGRRLYEFSWTGFRDTKLMPVNSLRSSYLGLWDGNSLDLHTQIIKKTLDQSFIFIPDGTNYDPESFMIARWEDPETSYEQLSPKLYSFSNSIIESW